MKISEFIVEELKGLAINEAKNLDRIEFEKINSEIEYIKITEDGDLEDFFKSLKTNENLLKLKVVSSFVELASKGEGEIIGPSDILEIEKRIITSPNNRLLPLLWFSYIIESFTSRETLEIETAHCLNSLFEKYSFLVELEDFFEKTDILNYGLISYNSTFDIFVPVFEKAIIKYPQKIYLKSKLGHLYLKNKDYNKAIDIFDIIIDQINSGKSDRDLYDDFYFLTDIMFCGMCCERTGQIDKSLKYVNHVIKNMPTIYYTENGKDIEEPEYMGYIEAFFTRMRISLLNNDIDSFISDYNIIKPYFVEDWYKEEFGDIFENIKKYCS